MQTLMLDGSRYASGQELHAALKRMLSLPDYYGMNADALNDCLSESGRPVSLWILSRGNEDVAAALGTVCRVVEDLGGEVREVVTP